MTKRRNKAVSWLVIAVFSLVIFCSSAFIITHAEHDCGGEDCSICMELRAAEAVISNTGMAAAAVAAIISFLIITVYKPVQKQTKLVGESLISLKVELRA